MAEINKEKSAARLASLKKCAAPCLGTIKKSAELGRPAAYFSMELPSAVKRIAGGLGGAIVGAAGGGAAGGLYGLTGVTTDKEKRKNWIRTMLKSTLLGAGAGAVGGGLFGARTGNLLVDGLNLRASKAAEDRSAARLEALKKCAAADRSAARLEALKKCAEHNLTKVSEERSAMRRLALMKSAGVATDVAATLPTYVAGAIPLLGILPSLASIGGSLGGLAVKPKVDKNPETTAANLIPGVGHFRLSQRSRRMADMSERAGKPGIANLLAEKIGPMTSSLVGAGAGALGGLGLAAAAGGDTSAKGLGAGIGAGVGVAAPLLIASLAAAIKRRRTNAEQVASDTTGRAVAKYLVPGLATYDDYKRLGASGNNDQKKASADRSELRHMALQKRAAVKTASDQYRSYLRYSALIGAGLGALGGNVISEVTEDEKKPRSFRETLNHTLGGAVVGSLAGSGLAMSNAASHKALVSSVLQGFKVGLGK